MSELRIAEIKRRIEPLRQRLLSHEIYQRIDSLELLRVFMQHHVFAVWDFMSLLKSLQRKLCCIDIPWIPPANAYFARLVNEIVLGEETDRDRDGKPRSHFELYLNSMTACGADTGPMTRTIDLLRQGKALPSALASSGTPPAAAAFVHSTFETIESNDSIAIASSFSFGREDLLPDVFRRIVASLDACSRGELAQFLYYLDRHIEVDGGDHGPMAERLIAELCGESEGKWKTATETAVASLEARIRLWDGTLAKMTEQPTSKRPPAAKS